MGVEVIPSPERLREDAQHIIDWLSKQPHLPHMDDVERAITALHYNKYSVEKTKRKIDNYFTYRTKYPEILKNRDPTGPEIQQARAAYIMAFADKATKDDELVVFGRLSPDTDLFEMTSVMKMFFMLADTISIENDRHCHLVTVTDCRDYSYVHFLKSVPWFKLGVDIFFGGFSGRVKAMHIINFPPSLNKILNAIKAFFPQKFADRMYFHPTTEDLCKIVDRDVVCSDFGGDGPSLAVYEKHTWARIEKHRDWFLEQDNICSNEELRPKSDNDSEELQGTFRKLQVD